MSYPEAIQYLESFINYEKTPTWSYKESLKLERIKDFLAAIDNPQDSLRCIHVAGSKGKGSTCAFIAYMLREAGYRVGLYTSPHLSDFRERIRILEAKGPRGQGVRDTPEFEGMIAESGLVDLVERLKPAIEAYNKISKYGPLSFFEVYTSLAFVYFKEKKTNLVVLETGLGGRLDATNVVNPLVCAITPISYEHTQKLGNTLREIALEKAGIIKYRKPNINPSTRLRVDGERGRTIKNQKLIVLSAPQEKEAMEAVREKCAEANAKIYELGQDIKYYKLDGAFSVKGISGEYPDLKIQLLGEHQLVNASVAVAVIEALGRSGLKIDTPAIKKGLYDTCWPGRCEVIQRNPVVVLDGAQNVASANVLKRAIRDTFQYKKLILVLGISKDKDIKGICRELGELADEVVLTKAQNPRATDPDILGGYFKGKKTYLADNVKESKALAFRLAQDKDLILVTGSLFVVGEFRDGAL